LKNLRTAWSLCNIPRTQPIAQIQQTPLDYFEILFRRRWTVSTFQHKNKQIR
jgi:hypothetical protein